MKSNNIMNTIFKNNLIIPNILLENYRILGIDEKELIFVSYLMSYQGNIQFDLNHFCKFLNYSTTDIMSVMATLTEKKLINMTVKEENGKIKEYIDISMLNTKLLKELLLEEQEKEEEHDDSKIYQIIEKEFGRAISPIECETIKHWLDSKISEELIEEALKEAVLNGVNNLKYIDRILFDWTKKGYKSKKDIKKKTTKEQEVVDIFEYDWLGANE